MERIKIDADLHEKIKNLTTSVELVDDKGFVVAVVQPHLDPEQYDLYGEELSPEEIERRCQPGRKTYTTDEVLAMLRKLP
jgi:hypothetical protein